MASTSDLIRDGIKQASSGKSLDSDTIGGGTSTSINSGVQVIGDEDVYRAENSTVDTLLPSEDAPTDSQETSDSEVSPSEAKSEKELKTSGNKEVITITDEKGKRKVEVDFSDKDKLTKYVQMAHGARKWQAERDQARTQVEEVRTKLTELESNWKVMNEVFQSRGAEGLIDLLEGREGAYKEKIQREMQKAQFLENASPEELESFNQKEAFQKTQKELDKIRKENQEFKQRVTEEKEQAELASIESKVHPVFDRYRFADKLGSADDEQMFDEMLWSSAIKRLEPYEERGLITPELIEREFKAVATAIRNRIGLQAEKKASKALDQKKKEATENVQAKVMSGYKKGGSAEEARNLINDGNLTGLLKNWGKYGSLFNGGKK